MEEITPLLEDYQPSQRVVDLLRSMNIVLLVGISGAGKSLIESRLLEKGDYHNIISHTTRKPRVNHGVVEREGDHYHFVGKPAMIEMVKRHEFVEVNAYSDNLYGMSGGEFERASEENKIALAAVDINGAIDMVRIASKAVRLIFLVPPSYDVWYSRWQRRYGSAYGEHTEDLTRRLQTAMKELEQALSLPYISPVVNDDLEITISEVDEIARTGIQSTASQEAGVAAIKSILAHMKQH